MVYTTIVLVFRAQYSASLTVLLLLGGLNLQMRYEFHNCVGAKIKTNDKICTKRMSI